MIEAIIALSINLALFAVGHVSIQIAVETKIEVFGEGKEAGECKNLLMTNTEGAGKSPQYPSGEVEEKAGVRIVTENEDREHFKKRIAIVSTDIYHVR